VYKTLRICDEKIVSDKHNSVPKLASDLSPSLKIALIKRVLNRYYRVF
jgi:hypothetical protein